MLFWGPKNILKEITLFLKNDAQMDPNWVPKPNKINKNSNEICGKVQRIVSNTNAYNRISVVWGGGDDTPHGVFDYSDSEMRMLSKTDLFPNPYTFIDFSIQSGPGRF